MQRNKFWMNLLVAGALLPLAACQTSFEEFRQNVSQNVSEFKMPSFSRQKPAEETAISMDGIHACPEARIIDDLASLSEFTDVDNPSDKTKVSAATMELERISCVYSKEHGSVAVQMTIAFHSELGPRSKIYKGDKPNFAYPYFVAVTDQNEEIVAKEVFAASISYESDQNKLTHLETLRQIVPLDDIGNGPDYGILIGFQLTEDQLAYNRKMEETATLQQPVITPWQPETSPASAAPLSVKQASPKPAIKPAGFVAPTPPKPVPTLPAPKKAAATIGDQLRAESQMPAAEKMPAADKLKPAPQPAPAQIPQADQVVYEKPPVAEPQAVTEPEPAKEPEPAVEEKIVAPQPAPAGVVDLTEPAL